MDRHRWWRNANSRQAGLNGIVRPLPYGANMATATQLTLDDLGVPLHSVTFVVVDLETDGGTPTDAGITEFGAVKVRGGEVLGEFQSLVRLSSPLPPFITALTGISNAMLADAPPLSEVLPAFLEFASGAVLVAHNAPYDVGFLKGACQKLDHAWPAPTVIDTARIARAVLVGDEVPNRKLATLAQHFRAATTPNHRALADARATVDVLHGLIARVGNLGVHSLAELAGLSVKVPDARRRKRMLAEGLPEGPGVYIFEDARGCALYVGTSKSVRNRVRSYFTAAETRKRMTEMIAVAERVVAVPTTTALEAQIQELRIIAAREPRYNRRSTRPQRAVWLKLTVERFPRISMVSSVRGDGAHGAAYIGPYVSRRSATAAAEALGEALTLRSCTQTLTAKPQPSACVLADLGRCSAPCVGRVTQEQYAEQVGAARRALTTDPDLVVQALMTRIAGLARDERFEDAAQWRDRLSALLRGIDEASQSSVLGQIPHLVAAAPRPDRGWDVHVIRHGRLAGAGSVPPGVHPQPHVQAIVTASQTVAVPTAPATAALPEESALLRRWLYSPGVRLVDLQDPGAASLALPVTAAARYRNRVEVDLRSPVAGSGWWATQAAKV